jgi:hypothetical protein
MDRLRSVDPIFSLGSDLDQDSSNSNPKLVQPVGNLEFIKKFVRTERAIVFRLSNSIVQLNFFDHRKLLLYIDRVIFVNAQRVLIQQTLHAALHSNNPSLIDCIHYAKEIIFTMLSKRQRRQFDSLSKKHLEKDEKLLPLPPPPRPTTTTRG